MSRPVTAAVRLLSGEREPARVATTANLDLYGLETVDDIALAVADRVLVKDQSDARENGIYTVSTGRWYRASDANHPRAITEGVTVQVQEGTANSGKAYRFRNALPNIGSDDIIIDFYLSANFAEDAEAIIQQGLTDLGDKRDEVIGEIDDLAEKFVGSLGARYTFSSATANEDPGPGFLRLSNGTQSSSVTVRVDTADQYGADISGLFDSFDDSTSATKGFLRIYKLADPTKWLIFAVTAVASPAGYRNITVSNVAGSDTSPFDDGDTVLLSFAPSGDKGEKGDTGEPGIDGAGSFATRAALAAVVGPTAGDIADLSEEGREGSFVFRSTDLSTEVTADSSQGVYVAPTSDATGASGAWVRVFDGLAILAKWTGGDLQDAVDLAASVGAKTVAAQGTHTITSTLALPAGVRVWSMPGAATVTVANGSTLATIVSFEDGSGIDGITVDANRANRADNANHFTCYVTGDDVEILNSKILNSTGYAILIRNSLRYRIERNRIENAFVVGIMVLPTLGTQISSFGRIEHNHLLYTGQYCIAVNDSVGVLIHRNRCEIRGVFGMVINVTGTTVTLVSGPTFENLKAGEFIIANAGLREMNISSIESATSLTISVAGGDLSNVPAGGGGGDAIGFVGSDRCDATYNDILGGASIGMTLSVSPNFSTTRCRIAHNRVTNSGSCGYSAQTYGGRSIFNCAIIDNEAVACGQLGSAGAAAYNSGCTISGLIVGMVVDQNRWLSYGSSMSKGLVVESADGSVLVGQNQSEGMLEVVDGGIRSIEVAGFGTAVVSDIQCYGDTYRFQIDITGGTISGLPTITVNHRVVPIRRKMASLDMVFTNGTYTTLRPFTAPDVGNQSTFYYIGGAPTAAGYQAVFFGRL